MMVMMMVMMMMMTLCNGNINLDPPAPPRHLPILSASCEPINAAPSPPVEKASKSYETINLDTPPPTTP